MSVQLLYRVMTDELEFQSVTDRPSCAAPGSPFRYDGIVLSGWMISVFTLVVSLAMGCLIAFGLIEGIGRDSFIVHVCTVASILACIVLGLAFRYERLRTRPATSRRLLIQ
jgi:hypothetical protein